MRTLNGDETVFKISNLIKKGHVKPIIIGHSSDDNDLVKNNFS